MASVTVPASFFRSELRVYADWREAFARELLQNSLDAGASRIEATFSTVEGHGRVTFTDNGCGMSRQVLEEVFFALGRTTKESSEAIGGFGRARIVICFAQHRYRIRTGHLLVEGQGGEYTVSEVADDQPGCEFVVDLLDPDTERVEQAFMQLLATCDLPARVTLDGHNAPRTRTPTRASKVLRDAAQRPWAKVYVVNGLGEMTMRVHGLTMFSRWLPGSEDVIVELTSSRSREVLSASRDRLHDTFAEQIDRFVADLSFNRRRALAQEDAPLDVRVGGGGFLRTDAATEPHHHIGDTATTRVPGGTPITIHPANTAAVTHMAALPPVAHPDAGNEEPRATAELGFDVYLLADARTTRVRRLARSWDPSFWGPRTGRRRRALLLVWKEAVALALEVLVRSHPEVGSVTWTVGWTFGTARAVHRDLGEGHVLALNPVDEDDTTRYRVSRRADRHRLLAVAVHEVAHVAFDGHDETYAQLLTELFGELDVAAADRALRLAARE